MAKLTGQTIAASYDQLLIVGDADGITATPQAVESADDGGNASLLYISTTEVYNPGTGGTSNTAFGKNAGDALDSGGNYNVFLGEEAGSAMATGTNNIAIGYGAFDAAAAGEDDCIAIGLNALGNLNHASSVRNIAIGSGSGDGMGTLAGSADNIFMGYDAGGGTWSTAVSTHNVGIGNYSMDDAMNGALYNVGIGHQSLSALTTADGNVCVGYQAGLTASTGYEHVLLGWQAGKAITTGNNNIAIGRTALQTANTQSVCIAIGGYAGHSLGDAGSAGNNDANGSVFIGYYSGQAMTNGIGNTGVGHESLATNVIGDFNTGIGYQALTSTVAQNNAEGQNTAVGYNAGKLVPNSERGTYIGSHAFDSETNNDCDDNTAVGAIALGALNASGNVNNVAVGASSCSGVAASNNSVYVGHNCQPDGTGAVNQIVIGQGTTGVADNSVTLGNASVTAVYMAQDKDAIVYCGGIQFDDDGEVLESYEEGNWTPSFVTSNADGTFVYDVRTAKYTKIGNTVHCLAKTTMNGSGNTSGSGSLRITGLPFTSDSNGYMYGNISVGATGTWGTTVGAPTHGYVGPNVTIGQLRVYDNDGGNIGADVDVNAADMTNSTDIVYSVVYRVS